MNKTKTRGLVLNTFHGRLREKKKHPNMFWVLTFIMKSTFIFVRGPVHAKPEDILSWHIAYSLSSPNNHNTKAGEGGMGAGREEGRLHKKIERVVAANLHS